MRFPWISRAYHEEIVAILRQRLAESEIERKRTQDAYYKQLGVEKLHFPDVRNADAPETEAGPRGPEEIRESQRAADLRKTQYMLRSKPSQLGSMLTNIFSRESKPIVPTQHAQPVTNGHKKASTLFDQVEKEVKEKHG
jgi:hypothetical protein